MHLLVDSANVISPGGRQLIQELARSLSEAAPKGGRVTLLRPGSWGPESAVALPSVRDVPIRVGGSWLGMWFWYTRRVVTLAETEAADVVYSVAGILSRRLTDRFATVNSVNNMLPFTPELMAHFAAFSAGRARLVVLQKLMAASSARAGALVVPSAYGGRRVAEYARVDLRDRTFVARNPVPDDVRFRPEAPPAHPHDDKPFLFYLSVVHWYKNQTNLIRAYRKLVDRGVEPPELFLAGPPADREYVGEIERTIQDLGLDGRVHYLGKIPRDDVPRWIHHATINVFPSTCETSSFVQAEILGAGGVMACSNIDPMPEVAGRAAELFDPNDPDSIADTLERLLRDETRRAELRRAALDEASQLTWRACGRVAWEAARHALAGRRDGEFRSRS